MAETATKKASPTPGGIKPKNSELDVEVGVSQNLPFTEAYKDGTSREIIRSTGGDEGPTAKQLGVMRRTDGQSRALYRLITLPIRAALKTSTFLPAEGGEKEAKFIEDMFTLPPNAGGMTTPFSRFMAQVLLAIFDGFSAFEQVYWVPKTGPLKGKITLRKLAHRPSDTVTFLADESGGFHGLRQRASYMGKSIDVNIPTDRAFYYACQEEERLFYGVSMFQAAFYHYDKKARLYYIAHLAAQRSAVDTRVGTIGDVNASAPVKNSFKRALADLGVAQYISLPSKEWKVDTLKGGTQFNFLEFINHHNSQMSKSVLANFFDKSQGGAADSTLVNFGEQSDALFILMLQTLMDEIAEAINTHIIPKFIDWNFGSSKYPRFRWGTFTDEQKEAVKTTFDKLATASPDTRATPEFFREVEKKIADEMGLEIDWDAVEQREQEQADAAAAANGAPPLGGEPPVPGGSPIGPEGPPPGADPGTAGAGGEGGPVDQNLPPSEWGLSAPQTDLFRLVEELHPGLLGLLNLSTEG